MRSETASRTFFLALFVLTLYLMLRIFKPFLPGIAWAVVLAAVLHPAYRRLSGWMGGRQWLAAILMAVLVGAFLVVPTGILMVQVGQGAVQAYQWLEAKSEAGEPLLDPKEVPWLEEAQTWLGRWVDVESINVRDLALSAMRAMGGGLAGRTRAVVSGVVATVLTVVVLLVTLAVLFHEGPKLLAMVRRFLPLSEPDKDEALERLRAVTRAVFLGVILTAAIQGIMGGIGFAIVGLPYAVAFGALTFLLALLPLVGAAMVWVPAVIWLFLAGHPVKALILLVWGATAVSSLDNVLRPIFIGRALRLHMLLVFFGILGGLMAFGMVGLFLGPIVITLFLFLLDVLRRDLFRDVTEPRPEET
jgi:predicted PurR-regulated permease PerM